MTQALWVDDCKDAPEGFAVARTYDDAFRLLMRFDYDELYLDHDLGDPFNRTGYDLLMDLIEAERVPARVDCISWNPAGKKRIEDALANYHSALTHRVLPPHPDTDPLESQRQP